MWRGSGGRGEDRKMHWHRNGRGLERKMMRGWHGTKELGLERKKTEGLVGVMKMELCLLMPLQFQMEVVCIPETVKNKN